MPDKKPLNKLIRPRAKGQITLPIEFRRKLAIDDETILSLTLKEGCIEIIPLRPALEEGLLRNYKQDEIDSFIAEDRIDPKTAAKVRRLLGRKGTA
jgi:bifunctional DNA-binding transcriptional regulator/antitoxin component of YhaV-PrlF toxin-antitoxin module